MKHGTIFIVAGIAAAALLMQAVHFFEHLAQVAVWIFGAKKAAYMTPLGMWAMDQVGKIFYPNAEMPRQAKLAFETLHLIGNGIFLVGIIALSYFVRTKKVIWAFIVEGFHFYEHVSLTVSTYYLGKAIGISTFFGASVDPGLLLGYRVWWHFIFNFIPSVLIAMVVWQQYKKLAARKSISA